MMANIERHLFRNGIEAWVSVAGKALPQYGEIHDELKNEVACWIPSETDKINLAFLAYKQLTDTKAYRSFL